MNALRNPLFLAAFLLIFHANSVSQTRVQKIKVYNSIISTVLQGKKHKGPLMEVRDSSVTVLSKGGPVSIPSNSIKGIKFKRTASVGRGAAVGGVTGFFVGLIIGFASGDDECPPGSFCIYQATAAEKGLAGGIVLGAAGSVVGVIVGAASHTQKIKINGDQKIFLARREDIRMYARPR
jgi:hypothetical protein